jgi:hypothetical protein
MANHLKILGFCASAEADALAETLSAVPGPLVSVYREGELAAVAQADRPRGKLHLRRSRVTLLRELASVQRRLEVACLHGPFLPADPAHGSCLASHVGTLLAESAPAIDVALRGIGKLHQWDVVLRWQAEPVVAARRAEIAEAAEGGGRAGLADAVASALARDRADREASLSRALTPVTLAIRAAGAGTTETGFTVLLPAGGEAVLETALCGLDEATSSGASADLRGPLPPLSFAAVRIEIAAPALVAQAWHTLALPDWVDAAGLRRHWHACAEKLHPDHGMQDDGPITEAGAAFRLLRGLLPADAPEKAWSLPALQRRGAMRLMVPAPTLEMMR